MFLIDCFEKSLLLNLVCLIFVTGFRWEPLNVGLARPANTKDLPDKMMRGLDDAINSLNKFIFVRIPEHEEISISRESIFQCSKNRNFETDLIMIEKFLGKYSITKHDISHRLLDLTKTGINFLLFLTTDSEHCRQDPFMLAGASPCMEPNGKLSIFVPRPICGKLIICLQNPVWKNFASSFDLFRHEIMHALGFGTINPDKYGQSTKSETRKWNNNFGLKPDVHDVHYMDFSLKATKAAKTYFNCDDIVGIEAENKEKIHLNEYIYGNELMTPVVSNGPNYFTYLSALILESTHLGKISWYKTNRTSVKIESRHYWYGRNWGCSFVLGSCYDYMATKHTRDQGTAFPFCDETDLKDYLYSRRPKKVCFSNRNETKIVKVTCNLVKQLVQTVGQFKPKPLLHQFPLLRRLLDGVGYPVYGSDSFHRYCPMVKELLEDQIRDLPLNAEIVPCP